MQRRNQHPVIAEIDVVMGKSEITPDMNSVILIAHKLDARVSYLKRSHIPPTLKPARESKSEYWRDASAISLERPRLLLGSIGRIENNCGAL